MKRDACLTRANYLRRAAHEIVPVRLEMEKAFSPYAENPTPAFRRSLRVSEGCATRRYIVGRIQLSSGVYNRAVHFRIVSGASGVEGARARAFFLYGTSWRARAAATIRVALSHDVIAQAAAL